MTKSQVLVNWASYNQLYFRL